MMKTKKIRKKPTCKQSNIACGYRCQPKSFKCPARREKRHEGGGAGDLRVVDDLDKAQLGYLEAQIFGGVSLKDIEFMSIPSYFFRNFF